MADKILKKNSQVVSRNIGGQTILMPVYNSLKDSNAIYTLNETASCIWSLMDEKLTLSAIKERIREKYAVSQTQLDQELEEFIADLNSIKALS